MIVSVFIEPHERAEALEAYKERLSVNDVEIIDDAPEGAIVKVDFRTYPLPNRITIIEEG